MLAHFHNHTAGDLGLPGSHIREWRPDDWQAQKHLTGSTRYDLGLCTLNLRAAGAGQVFLVAQVAWGAHAASAARAAYSEVARVLQDQGLAIVHERLFGSLTVKRAVLAARDATFRAKNLPPNGPITYVQGHPPWGEGLAGVIIRAVVCRQPQDEVWAIRDQGRAVGRGWRQGEATFLLLQNIQGLASNGNGGNGSPHQAKRMIQRAAEILEGQGATYRDVARTWFYLSDILGWYPEFNQARSALYRELDLMPVNGGGARELPASTGIRGEVSPGAAGALDLLAVMGPPESRPLVRQLRSPAQPEALTYGSAFSRGALIHQGDVALIQVSGTAAIDEQGRSLYPGDARAQIDGTFDKIAALIGPEGATLADIAAACVFIKRPGDARIYQERAAARGLENLPAVVMVADVCRDELLFEMDAEVAFDIRPRKDALTKRVYEEG
jgi:enamine deaminase RidA (YjgF/YER057c/UK114 family)